MSRISGPFWLDRLILLFGVVAVLSGCQSANRQSMPITEVHNPAPVTSAPITVEAAKPTLPDPTPALLPVEQRQARIVTTAEGETMLQPAIPVMEALAALSACAQSEGNVARSLRQMKPENIDRAAPNFERIVAAHAKFLQEAARRVDAIESDPILMSQWLQIQQPSEDDAPRVATLRQRSRLSTEPLVSESLLAAIRKVLDSPQATAVLPAITQLREAYLAAPTTVVTAEQRRVLVEALGETGTELPVATP